MKDKRPDKSGDPNAFSLTLSERRALKGFRAQYKFRFLNLFFLLVTLAYCIGVGGVSVYFAYEVFTGAKTFESIQAQTTSADSINQTAARFAPFMQDFDFFGIGWTQLLHAGLLFYLGSRSFRMLYQRWRHTPRAKLALKLARRLEELGELDLS